MRPQSIVTFERLYIAAFVLGIVSIVQTWSIQTAMLDRDPRLAAIWWLPHASLAMRCVIAGMLWYFVARQPAVVAKWIVVALAGYGAILLAMLLYGLVTGAASIAIVVPSAAQNILYIAAAAMLFRPDAREWFGEGMVA